MREMMTLEVGFCPTPGKAIGAGGNGQRLQVHRRKSVAPKMSILEGKRKERERPIVPVEQATGLRMEQVVNAKPEKEVEIESSYIELPTGEIEAFLPNGEQITSSRKAEALVMLPKDSNKQELRGAVFAHGFSQRPKNYASTLQRMAAEGAVVVSPTSWLFSVALPWQKVEYAGRWGANPPSKLQTALAIDVLRSIKLVQEIIGEDKTVTLTGHSMGSACSLIATSLLQSPSVDGICIEAPAVGPLEITEINPLLALKGEKDEADARKFFEQWRFKPNMSFITAPSDLIVTPSNTKMLNEVASEVGMPTSVKELTTGSHFGYLDELDVDVDIIPIVDTVIFWMISLIIYRAEIFRKFLGDYSEQLKEAQDVLVLFLKR